MNDSHSSLRASLTRRNGLRLIAALTIAVCLVSSGLLLAQKKPKKGQETRSVQGTVTTENDAPVAGAVVQLKNTKTLQIRSFITRENGTYVFYELSPDVDYELTARANGATSGSKTLSSFDSRTAAIINLKLNPKK
ncbi:MAG TPA: carboxypeptidase-like regulatory domain-containing protein [Bryobacteraceae bacterium]|nr:carboxypeptidase-like regulatory domain-containing protein [Bryobacteraceae bacterium]